MRGREDLKFRSLIQTIATAVLCAVLLSGCTQTQEPQPRTSDAEVLLGFSQLGSESGWRLGNTRDVQEAAKRANV